MPSSNIADYDTSLPTISDDGRVPSTRISSAEGARNLVLGWIRNDQEGRAPKRGRVAGLVQGNPPYRQSDLNANGRSDACNVNWRVSESYLESATGAFYDLFSEAPTFATVDLKGDDDRIPEWSGIVTEEFHELLRKDRSWDAVMQLSIQEMVLYGAGPLIFENKTDWRNRNVIFSYLQVPDDASSDINRWECGALRVDYLPHQLFEFVRREEAARDVGWDVAATRDAIQHAYVDVHSDSSGQTWEWHQQQLKQDSFSYSARSRVIQAVHFFAKEFPREQDAEAKISHVIFLLNPSHGDDGEKFLFKSLHAYDNWQQCVHPMYYSQGYQGKHYATTGMGVKMYGAMECQNRLLCNAYDKTFAPKVMFKPTSAAGKQKMLLTRFGDYAVLPDGYEMQQVGLNGMIEDSLLLNRELSGVISSNLSTYRQNLQAPKSGNPITKAEAEIRANDQSRLGKTQLNRYYEQLDWLYEEKYRRAASGKLTRGDPGGALALDFQKACLDRGVPREMLQKYYCVKATRVVGQGSQYLRQQTNEFLLALAGSLPEDGRENLLRDVIAGRAGQYMVNRYAGKPGKVSRSVSDQQALAMLQVASMREGVPAVFSPSQNPVIFAQTFLQAAGQSLASLQKQPPDGVLEASMEVLSFLDLTGPAIAMHLERLSSDPLREQLAKALAQQFQQLSAATDQLRAKVAGALQKQREARDRDIQQKLQAGRQALAAANGHDPETVVGLAKVQSKSRLDQFKASESTSLKRQKAQVDMALSDARTASEISNQAAKTEAEVRLKARKTEADIAVARAKAAAGPASK